MARAEKKRTRVDERLKSIGIIMDGNGRWATKRGLSRSNGHIAGAKAISPILKELRAIGINYVTLYAFSTENWSRPQEEVDGLMELIYKYLDEVVVETIKNDPDFSMCFLGDKSRLPAKLRDKCIEIENMAKGRRFVCNLALNYGGRAEIVHAVNEALAQGCSVITEQDISRNLYTADTPDPDLIIRTGGDLRVSNFLIWQGAYSELYVTKTLWPEFTVKTLHKAIKAFYKRKRRFGGLDKSTAKNK